MPTLPPARTPFSGRESHQAGGSFTMHYTTVAVSAARTGTAP